jgi:cytochrome c oxidase assembly protein subunit 15
MANKKVGVWLLTSAACTAGVITYGGYTRLKRAGLAMIDWKPHSISRPSTAEQWQEEFERWKKTPDYTVNNIDIEVEEFAELYNIEWTHRMLARGLGLVFAVPMLAFWKSGALVGREKMKMLTLLGLGGLQGGMGWIMVKSGIEPIPEDGERAKVNPYKLAAHQFAGISLYSLLFWNAMNHLRGPVTEALPGARFARKGMMGAFHLALATMFTGAFMAGTDASCVMNNWPFYGQDKWFPDNAWTKDPWWRNFFENKGLVQVGHRTLAALTYLYSAHLWLNMRSLHVAASTRFGTHLIFLLANWQFLLGITTLRHNSRFEEALSHQVSGLAFLSTLLYGLHTVRRFR